MMIDEVKELLRTVTGSITGSSATYRYGLPLRSGLPHPLPNGTVVIYMLAVSYHKLKV
jgi:hypothetical protein